MIEIPEFANDDEERQFWAEHDSVDFLDGFEQVWLEYVWNEEVCEPKISILTDPDDLSRYWRITINRNEVISMVEIKDEIP